jgi:hypothetical protein
MENKLQANGLRLPGIINFSTLTKRRKSWEDCCQYKLWIITIDANLFLIIGGVIGVLALAFFWLMPMLLTRRWNQHKAKTVTQWETEGVKFKRGPVGGKFGGLESMKVSQVHPGVGYVALTDKDLRVTRLAPFGVWIVPFKQIKGITLRSTFMGNRGQKTPFIVVRFTKEGQLDKLGFQVGEHEAWAKALAQAAKVSLKSEVNKARA